MPRAGAHDDAVAQVIGFTFAGVIFMGLIAYMFYAAVEPDEDDFAGIDASEGPWRAQAESVLAAVLKVGSDPWEFGGSAATVLSANVSAAKASSSAYSTMLGPSGLDLPEGTQVRVEFEHTDDPGTCPGIVSFGSGAVPDEAGQAEAYRQWTSGTAVASSTGTWTAACTGQVEVRVFVFQ